MPNPLFRSEHMRQILQNEEGIKESNAALRIQEVWKLRYVDLYLHDALYHKY